MSPTIANPLSIQPSEFVRVINRGTERLTLSYHSRKYTIPPQHEGFVPFEAFAIMFGDPRSTTGGTYFKPDHYETPIGIPPRGDILHRLYVLYGVGDTPEKLLETMPSIEAYTMEGDRITLVAEDPECELPTMPLDLQDASPDIQTRLAQLERELAVYRKLASRSPTNVVAESEEASADASEIKEDGAEDEVGTGAEGTVTTPVGPPAPPLDTTPANVALTPEDLLAQQGPQQAGPFAGSSAQEPPTPTSTPSAASRRRQQS